jgi:hypothetical protein
MSFCPMELNDGLWQCPECGYRFPRSLPKPPIRNCPGSAPPATTQPALIERLRLRHHSPPHLPWEEVKAAADTALACPRFDGRRCNRFPGCGGVDRFLTELLYRGCCLTPQASSLKPPDGRHDADP